MSVGLLTQKDVRLLGPSFRRLWLVEDAPCFSQLIQAIDEADRDLSRLRLPDIHLEHFLSLQDDDPQGEPAPRAKLG
jgi:hypothetical protein